MNARSGARIDMYNLATLRLIVNLGMITIIIIPNFACISLDLFNMPMKFRGVFQIRNATADLFIYVSVLRVLIESSSVCITL